MNILFVSGTHPATPHISGVRAARFAEGLAQRGHRCVLLCPALPGQDADPDFAMRAEAQDWRFPLIVTVVEEISAPAPRSALGALATAGKLLLYGGKRISLARALAAKGRALSKTFQPEILWATFGSLETVFVARRLAQECGVRWIFDVKDNVENYIPRRLHQLLAWRVGGFGALTSNADLHARAANRWLGTPSETIYSGVDDCFFVQQDPVPDHTAPYVTLVGGLYHRDLVEKFVAGVAAHNRDPSRPPLEIVHIGAQLDMLEDVAARHDGVRVRGTGYVDTKDMARVCQSAVANAYIFFGLGFHHKLFELFACGRPVVAFGGELPESIRLASDLSMQLKVPQDSLALSSLLAELTTSPFRHVDLQDRFFTWPDQAAMLERTMKRLIAHD